MSYVIPWKSPFPEILKVRTPSKMTKNNSQGIIFVRSSRQTVTVPWTGKSCFIKGSKMPLKIVFLRPLKIGLTKTLLLKHYYRRQGASQGVTWSNGKEDACDDALPHSHLDCEWNGLLWHGAAWHWALRGREHWREMQHSQQPFQARCAPRIRSAARMSRPILGARLRGRKATHVPRRVLRIERGQTVTT